MKNTGVQFVFIFLLIIAAFNFFDAHFLNEHLVHYVNFIFCAIAIAFGAPFMFIKGKLFELPVQLISAAILFSILMSYLSWGQGLLYSVEATVPALIWLFFFWLLRIKFPVQKLEVIVLIYAFIYIVLYLFQFMNPNNILFGIKFEDTGFYYSRDIFRLVFPGGGVFFLAIFMALNKVTAQKEGRPLWIMLAVIGLIVTLMQVTRTYIIAVLIIYIYHFFSTSAFIKRLKTWKKISLIAIICGFFILISNTDISVFEGLSHAQQQTSKEGMDNPRISAAIYFLKDFSPNIFSNIFGNGVPAASNQSYYGQYVVNLYTNEKFMDDVGIIGLFAMFGIAAVIGYVMIWIKSFTTALPAEYHYTKYYLWFILATSLTWDTVFSNYYVITTVFALYIFQRTYTDEKTKGRAPVSKYKYNFNYGLPSQHKTDKL